MTELKKAIFLDRDGVINELIPDVYVLNYGDFFFIPGVFEAIEIFDELGYEVYVISNQSGVGKGMISEADCANIFHRMAAVICVKTGVIINWAFCPHVLDVGCSCRKPKPGLIYTLAHNFELDLNNSWLVGDQWSDIGAGHFAGIPNLVKIDSPLDKVAGYEGDNCQGFGMAKHMSDLHGFAHWLVSNEVQSELKQTEKNNIPSSDSVRAEA